MEIVDEMPDAWVRSLADAIEAYGYEITDAHESAVVVSLPARARGVVQADDDERYVVVGWSGDAESDEPGTVCWGLSEDGAYISGEPQVFADETDSIDTIAGRVHRLLRTGRTEARLLQHAIPYAATSPDCCCPRAYPCGGIVPATDCPEHGGMKAPAMSRHWEKTCI